MPAAMKMASATQRSQSPPLQDALPEHAADHDRHGGDAAVGQDIGQRERMRAQPAVVVVEFMAAP